MFSSMGNFIAAWEEGIGGGDGIAKYIMCTRTCTYTVWQYYTLRSILSYLLAKGIKIQHYESFIPYKTNEAIEAHL
jgi:hypothetical protein